jgi:hypothetical protein
LLFGRPFISVVHTERMVSVRDLVSLLSTAFLVLVSSSVAQTGVTAVLPNGREIHPAGNWIPLAPYPFAIAVRADGAQIAVPSIGVHLR